MVLSTWKRIVRIGFDPSQSHQFTEKLQNRNVLCLLCAVFSCFYVCFFLVKQLYLPFFAISIGILLFIWSIYLNHLRRYLWSSVIVLINTNYCVLFFSLYLGFDSGIHLYLFTSPLIVLSLFFPNNNRFIYLAILSYIINFFIIIVVAKQFSFSYLDLTKEESNLLYTLNFIFTLLIIVSLSLYLLYNTEKINFLIFNKNKELTREIELRVDAEKKALNVLKERETLLAEVHHRVKNNLALISGLLNLQFDTVTHEESKIAFNKAKERIYSMALVHNQIYKNNYLDQLEFSKCINDMVGYYQSQLSSNVSVLIMQKTEVVFLDVNTAIPCALILNELLNNSITHAFKNIRHGVIEIGLKKDGDTVSLWISDSGFGMTKTKLYGKSIGMNILHALVEQLDAALTFENKNGCRFLIRFPNEHVK